MTAVLTIARLSITRMLRERSNLFFIFVFPMLLVLLIGLSFGGGGSNTTIAVVGPDQDALVSDVVTAIDEAEGLAVSRVRTRDLALDAMSRGRVAGILVFPPGFASAVTAGDSAAVEFGLRDESRGAQPAVSAALASVLAPLRAAALGSRLGLDEEGARQLAAASPMPAIEVQTRAVGDGADAEFASLGQFDLGASSQLILFVFISTLSGATRIVESRALGATRRMMAGPVSAMQVVAGEGLGRFAVAMFQAGWVVLGGLLMFSVNWGSPIAALVVITAFAATSAAAGLLLGAIAKNVNQASGVATLLGLTLAALGGCMAPLDIFSDGLRKIAHVTPHAWANDAFATLTRRDGGLGDVLVEVGVLLAFAAVLGAIAANRLKATITD